MGSREKRLSSFGGGGAACAKALGQEGPGRRVGGTGCRPLRLEQRERGREREEGRAGRDGQVVQGLVGHGRTWASTLQEAEALECCGQSGDSALTQVLTGALWWLPGRTDRGLCREIRAEGTAPVQEGRWGSRRSYCELY